MTRGFLDPRGEDESAGDEPVASTTTGIPIRNVWHMLLYAWDQQPLIGSWRGDVESAPSLDALLATILANLLQQRLRIGLGRDYDTHIDEIAGIRGRVLFGESIRRSSFPHGRAVCRYQVFTPDVPKNRIVRSTLAALVDTGDFGASTGSSALRGRLRGLIRAVDAARIVPLSTMDIGRERMRRHDRDYALMLAICHLIQRRSMPTETTGTASMPSIDRDKLTLQDVYEKFVARFYVRHLQDWHVKPQPLWRWPADVSSPFLPCLQPDLLLEHRTSGRIIVLDTKFTAKSLRSGRRGDLRFERDHLFQIYAYLRSQSHRSGEFATSTGILLYPSAQYSLSEIVEIQGHTIRWETIDLAAPWQHIETRLLAIPESTGVC